MHSAQVLVIGSDTPDLRTAIASLRGQGGASYMPGVQAAEPWLKQHIPTLIVLLQRFPGEIHEHELDQLRRQAPLARISVIAGSWCEGENRSGHLLEGVDRAYWHQWPARYAANLARLSSGEASAWSQPLTATDDERLLATAARQQSPRHIDVVSRERESGDALADACRQLGFRAIIRSASNVAAGQPLDTHGQRADCILWDADMRAVIDPQEVKIVCGPSGTPVVALVGFPRVDVMERALAAGVHSIVSKPFLLEDLGQTLAEAVTATHQPAS